jgi:hypothetical protein
MATVTDIFDIFLKGKKELFRERKKTLRNLL